MVGEEFDFDVQLCLMAKQVPGLVLTTRAVRKPMLGWTTWLKTQPFKADDDQLVLGFNG
jgi:predicted component of type VI protein secretion system